MEFRQEMLAVLFSFYWCRSQWVVKIIGGILKNVNNIVGKIPGWYPATPLVVEAENYIWRFPSKNDDQIRENIY